MKTIIILIIIVVAVIAIIAAATATWAVIHEFFKKAIVKIVVFISALIIICIGWKALWFFKAPNENPALDKYIIDKHYYGKDVNPPGTSDLRQPTQSSIDSTN